MGINKTGVLGLILEDEIKNTAFKIRNLVDDDSDVHHSFVSDAKIELEELVDRCIKQYKDKGE